MAEARGGARPAKAPSGGFRADLAAAGGIPVEVPAESGSEPRLPTESDLEEAAKGGPELLDQTLASFVLEYRAAPPGSPVKQRWGALILKGNDDRRKMTPPARPDPNEAPDLMAAARRARDTLHNLIETSPEDR